MGGKLRLFFSLFGIVTGPEKWEEISHWNSIGAPLRFQLEFQWEPRGGPMGIAMNSQGGSNENPKEIRTGPYVISMGPRWEFQLVPHWVRIGIPLGPL